MRVNSVLASIGVTSTSSPSPASPATPSTGGATTTFSDVAKSAVDAVHEGQIAADAESENLARGGGNVHEAALTLEKADIQMRLLVKSRNKVVEAYQEISRMPV